MVDEILVSLSDKSTGAVKLIKTRMEFMVRPESMGSIIDANYQAFKLSFLETASV